MRTHVLNNNIPNLKQGEDRTNTIEILIPADMRSYSLFLFFALPDGSKTFTPKLTMTDNKVSYIIPAGITAKTGRVTVELQGYLDNRLIKSVSYAFFVVAAVSTPTDPPFEDFVPWYLEVMQKADQVETDKSAVSAMKNQIKTDETQRQVNELARQADEETRKENEAGRQSTFAANEATRETNETARKAAEIARETAHVERTTTFNSWVDHATGLDARIDNIITTPAEGVSAQEIIDARDGEVSLGAKIRSVNAQIGLNVKTYGAKGDGITDDTVAIQNAIDYVASNSGGTVYLPTGVYRIEGILELDSNIRFVGDGISTVIDGVNGTTNNATIYPKYRGSRETYNGASNFSIENIAFNTSDRSRQGLYFDNCVNYKVINFWGLNTADHYLDINNSKNGRIINIYLFENDESNALFQIDSREGRNENLYVENLKGIGKPRSFAEFGEGKAQYPEQACLIHLHRTGGKNININGVLCENMHTVIHKDSTFIIDGLTIENVIFKNGKIPSNLTNAGNQPVQKNVVYKNWIIESPKLVRGLGSFLDIDGLIIDNISITSDDVGNQEFIRVRSSINVHLGIVKSYGEVATTDPIKIFNLENLYGIDVLRNVNFTVAYSGTFTPRLLFTNNQGNFKYSRQYGLYSVFGNRVQYDIRITVTSFDRVTGDLRVTGFPYEPYDHDGRQSAQVGLYNGFDNYFMGSMIQRFIKLYNTDKSFGEDVTEANLSDTFYFALSGNYVLSV